MIRYKFEPHWKYFLINYQPYLWLHCSKYQDKPVNFSLSVLGYVGYALLSIDTVHVSRFWIIHSLFWIRFTETAKNGEAQSDG